MMTNMLTLTARCPYCQETFRTALQADTPVVCGHCQKELQPRCPDWLLKESGEANSAAESAPVRCLACPSTELFVRKDFPQQLGVAIVATGFLGSSIAWYFHQIIASYAILFVTAGIDVVLYLLMGNVLECYRCHAQYRGLSSLEGHEGFNLETHERYRQQAARLQEAQAPATKSAPSAPAASTISESTPS